MPDNTNQNDFQPKLMVTQEVALHHAGMIGACTQSKDDAVMGLATAFENAEKAGVHKGAMKRALRAKKTDISKRVDEQRHFDFYCQVLGLNDQMDMADAVPAAEPEDGEDGDEDKDPEFD